ncbi:MAG: hypothetical protein RR565_09500 [Erysipelothrix sp.]|uniref:hypothetical protein n=1 Tax=Erysipelothrix inopinata TaxID=225084 RepID=UPI0030240821
MAKNNKGTIIKFTAMTAVAAGAVFVGVQTAKYIQNHSREQEAKDLLVEKYGEKMENKKVIIVDENESFPQRVFRAFTSLFI